MAICGSGIGACVAANKVSGVRAALITDVFSAHQGVEDDDMNVMCLGGLVVGHALAWELASTFLAARFNVAARHCRRLEKVSELENPQVRTFIDVHPNASNDTKQTCITRESQVPRHLLLDTASHSVLCYEHDCAGQSAIELWNAVARVASGPASEPCEVGEPAKGETASGGMSRTHVKTLTKGSA